MQCQLKSVMWECAYCTFFYKRNWIYWLVLEQYTVQIKSSMQRHFEVPVLDYIITSFLFCCCLFKNVSVIFVITGARMFMTCHIFFLAIIIIIKLFSVCFSLLWLKLYGFYCAYNCILRPFLGFGPISTIQGHILSYFMTFVPFKLHFVTIIWQVDVIDFLTWQEISLC